MSYFVTLALILFAYMNVWFVVSVIKRRNDVADVAWGLGFVLMAWASYVLSDEPGMRGLLVSLLVSVWGLRLAVHIAARHRDKPEDYRYAAWRATWGAWFYPRSYLQVYVLQGALLFLVVFPVLLINRNAAPTLGLLDVVGVLVWLVGFTFEVVSDAQLARFLKYPANKGKLLQSGLWAYSRHPNYFGEALQWWGLWLVALSVPYGVIGLLGPLTITFLLLKVSGVPMLEKKMAQHPDFAAYRQRVSMFIPLPPRTPSGI